MYKGIYLDHNATTPVSPEVLEAMLPFFREKFGNAASKHAFGWEAEAAVDQSRGMVAALLGCEKQEVTFTSGATEALNMAIKGIADVYRSKGKHILVSKTEHKAVLDTCESLKEKGYDIEYLEVNENGVINIKTLSKKIRPDTLGVVVMLANNETGVIQNIRALSKKVHEKKSILICDTTQAAGKIRFSVNDLGIDVACLSAHKMYGPKGVGAIFIRRKNPRIKLSALIEGGGHENGLRSGTLNVPGIVGLGTACLFAQAKLAMNSKKTKTLRDYLEAELSKIKSTKIIASSTKRLPNTSMVFFKGKKAEDILKKLHDIALSTGSACSSALPEPSHVLLAMGIKKDDAYSCVRFSLGLSTSKDEIEYVLEKIKKIT